jgi:hypothetical protein
MHNAQFTIREQVPVELEKIKLRNFKEILSLIVHCELYTVN